MFATGPRIQIDTPHSGKICSHVTRQENRGSLPVPCFRGQYYFLVWHAAIPTEAFKSEGGSARLCAYRQLLLGYFLELLRALIGLMHQLLGFLGKAKVVARQ